MQQYSWKSFLGRSSSNFRVHLELWMKNSVIFKNSIIKASQNASIQNDSIYNCTVLKRDFLNEI